MSIDSGINTTAASIGHHIFKDGKRLFYFFFFYIFIFLHKTIGF